MFLSNGLFDGQLCFVSVSVFTHEDQHKQALLIILDTNVLLSHLEFVKKIRSHGLSGKIKKIRKSLAFNTFKHLESNICSAFHFEQPSFQDWGFPPC